MNREPTTTTSNTLRTRPLSSTRRLRVQRYAAACRMPMHAHDGASVSVIARGCVFEDSPASASFVARPGDCILKPIGSRHENRFADVPTLSLQLQLLPGDDTRDWLQALNGRGYAIVRLPILARPLLRLLRTELSAAIDIDATADDLLADAMGALSSATRPSSPPPRWLWRAEREISARLPDPIRVADLADALNLHPAHLTRAFHGAYGCGVTEYVRRRRVQLAAELLAADRAEICAVAQRAGFHDQAHLTRSFREVLGTTPYAYRLACT